MLRRLTLAILLTTASVVVNASSGRPPMISFPEYKEFPRLSASNVKIDFTFKSIVTPDTNAEYHCVEGTRVFVIAGSPTRELNTVHVYDITNNLELELAGNLEYVFWGGITSPPNTHTTRISYCN